MYTDFIEPLYMYTICMWELLLSAYYSTEEKKKSTSSFSDVDFSHNAQKQKLSSDL